MKPRTAVPSWLMWACALGACTGAMREGAEADGREERPVDVGMDVAEACGNQLHPGPAPVRRLNRFEYNNTVRELLGDDTRPADAFPPEEVGNGFGNDGSALGVSRLLAEGYFEAAKRIAKRATTDADRYAKLLTCDPAKDDAACARSFVATFGLRAFRRPVRDDERDRLLAVFQAGRAGGDFRNGVEAVVTATLQMPQFLYRIEQGTPTAKQPTVAKLGSYEIASRLSYMLWASMPDDVLFKAAASGSLETKAAVQEQAERMLADPRAKEVVRFFHGTLFGLFGLDTLNKNRMHFPAFFADLGPLLREESERFIEHVVWEGAGDYKTMLTAPYSLMNGALAKFYGVQKEPTGEAFERVDLDPSRHAGFLTSGGVMAALTPGTETNPVLRGAWVRNKLFCDPPPDPPADLMVAEPDPDPTLTTRERFLAHQTEASCKGCHRLLDGIGFALENFDGIGRWRDTDNGKPVDASGDLQDTDVDGAFTGPVALMNKVVQSDQVRRCLSDHWMTFAYGRGFDEQQDACTRATLADVFRKSGGNVKQLMLALTQTDAFLYRPTVRTEVKP